MERKNSSNILWDFSLWIVSSVLGLHIIYATSYPLGLETSGLGIHQRQPSYMPTYNGIFSIHALNFTPSAVEAGNATSSLLIGNPTDSESHEDLNELDTLKIKGQRQQVITKTVTERTIPSTSTSKFVDLISPSTHTTVEDDSHEYDTAALKWGTAEISNVNDTTLLSEVVDTDQHPSDVFDHLMQSIQGHWSDFVGKMKLSVLDVWKSISQHMLERMESFASAL